MLAIALLLAASPVPQSLLDASDAAGLAQTQCLFATFRSARAAGLSPDAFAGRLRTSCSVQSQQLRRLSARIFAARGEAHAAAKAERLVDDSYRMMVDEYRRLPQLEKMARDLCGSGSTCR